MDEPKALMTHLKELRNRLMLVTVFFFACFLGCYSIVQKIQALLIQPLHPLFEQGRSLVYTSLPEAFFSEINTTLFASFLLTFPFLLVQVWLFLKPGLFHVEQKIIKGVMVLIPFLFYFGTTFAHTIVLPRAFSFFISFEHKEIPLYFLPKLSDYISFSQRLMFVFGLGFEIPIFLFVLVSLGVLSIESLKSRWRIIIFLLCVISAIITPPDALSMIALAVPMIVLYGLTVLVIQCTQNKIKNITESYHA
ncbi:MAG: twin-arginine translocase subunit TatC [Pseudomonadota bacterium]|jgi:sec-independent protein translocase protein TatC|nr:twin-arginine translocase subunit TatC [Alphaproteobacteria bacterium]